MLQLRLERAEEAGLRDVVTLVGNRRYFDATFAEELERARKTGGDFCLALADLDRFKVVNDRSVILLGDRILRLFAEILVQNIRGQDRVARFGGEEFALMLPGASLEEATAAVERIRRNSRSEAMGPRADRRARRHDYRLFRTGEAARRRGWRRLHQASRRPPL